MIFDLSDVVGDELATGTYSVTRQNAPTFTNGVAVPDPSPTTFPITAGIQPIAGRDLLRLPEGDRSREPITIFSPVLLRTADSPGAVAADLVSYQGKTYQVESVQDWIATAGFCRAVALKAGQ